MTKKFYLSKGIIPYESTSFNNIDFSKNPREIIKQTLSDDPNRRLYCKEQIELFKKESWFKEKEWIIFELRKHNISEEIPTFRGWTPHYDFENSKFKLENDINLIKIGRRAKLSSKPGTYLVGFNTIEVTPREMEYGRTYAGSKDLFEKNKEEVEKAFNSLNKSSIDFIVFRTYRGWPAVWDNIYFYSIGEFYD